MKAAETGKPTVGEASGFPATFVRNWNSPTYVS